MEEKSNPQSKPLKAYEQRAIQLKYEGASYDGISKTLLEEFKVERTPKAIADWFTKDGRLRGEYERYAEKENEIRRQEAITLFRANLKRAVLLLVSKLGSSDERIQIDAAKEIINRELGKAKEIMEAELKGDIFKDLAEWVKKQE